MWLFVFCVGRCFVFCLGLFLVCFLLSVLCVSVFALECDKGFGLCIGPLPVYFCGHYSFGPCTSQLINLICNMLGNMLNDLAEAIRRWTEKINASQTLEPETKGRIFHGHLRRSRATRCNQDAFLSNNLVAITASHINFCCIRLTFPFFGPKALRVGGARSLIWSAKAFAATFSLVYTMA